MDKALAEDIQEMIDQGATMDDIIEIEFLSEVTAQAQTYVEIDIRTSAVLKALKKEGFSDWTIYEYLEEFQEDVAEIEYVQVDYKPYNDYVIIRFSDGKDITVE